MGTCQDRISQQNSQYKPHPKSKARKMKVHSSRYSVFSFDPIDENPRTHPAPSQKDPRDAIPPQGKRRRSFYTQWSGSSSDKKDSFTSDPKQKNRIDEIPNDDEKKIKRAKTCEN